MLVRGNSRASVTVQPNSTPITFSEISHKPRPERQGQRDAERGVDGGGEQQRGGHRQPLDRAGQAIVERRERTTGPAFVRLAAVQEHAVRIGSCS